MSLTGDSYWPAMLSYSILLMMAGNIMWWKINHFWLLLLGVVILLINTLSWAKNLSAEANFLGQHTLLTQASLKLGMAFFIFSEVMFFFSFFWTYLDFGLNPVGEIGFKWPSSGICSLEPLSVPLLNTLILVSSGLTLTISHHYLLGGKLEAIKWLVITLVLGISFTSCQLFEYWSASYVFASGTYGSIFYMGTGFHGLHVLVGSILLSIALWKMVKMLFNSWHHVNFELAAWYWHFVDVVWLFLYTIVYWWSN